MCVYDYRHGSMVAGFGIMNTTFIRAELFAAKIRGTFSSVTAMNAIWCGADPWYVAR